MVLHQSGTSTPIPSGPAELEKKRVLCQDTEVDLCWVRQVVRESARRLRGDGPSRASSRNGGGARKMGQQAGRGQEVRGSANGGAAMGDMECQHTWVSAELPPG